MKLLASRVRENSFTEKLDLENGYKLVRDVELDNGSVILYVSHYKGSVEHDIEYLPTIDYDELSEDFTIQTTSYGSLSSNVIDRVIKGYQIAQETVRMLENKKEQLLSTERFVEL